MATLTVRYDIPTPRFVHGFVYEGEETERRAVMEALVAEHVPRGPTEEHLVEELAGIVWRKRRLRLAEAAAHRRGLEDTLKPYRETVKAALVHLDVSDQSESASDAVRSTAADTVEDMAEMEADEAMTQALRTTATISESRLPVNSPATV
jgi:hypothetical protein